MSKYYTVNESSAKAANDANSQSDYKSGSATELYREKVDDIYAIVEQIKEKKPELTEKAERMADRYSRKLADWYNAYYRNEASCVSWLISGGGNFPTGKKKKQNDRRDTLRAEWNELSNYADKIENLLTMKQPILSGDERAIELLEEKLEGLVELQEQMKAVNAYYRKNKTLDDCPDLTVDQIEKLKAEMSKDWHWADKPFLDWQLSNNNATIRSTRSRIEKLKAEKEAGDQEAETEFFRMVENKENMRLQLFFDGKPEPEVREILKSNGFRWAPSQEAWQRQLTNNARHAVKRVIEQLTKLQEGGTT